MARISEGSEVKATRSFDSTALDYPGGSQGEIKHGTRGYVTRVYEHGGSYSYDVVFEGTLDDKNVTRVPGGYVTHGASLIEPNVRGGYPGKPSRSSGGGGGGVGSTGSEVGDLIIAGFAFACAIGVAWCAGAVVLTLTGVSWMKYGSYASSWAIISGIGVFLAFAAWRIRLKQSPTRLMQGFGIVVAWAACLALVYGQIIARNPNQDATVFYLGKLPMGQRVEHCAKHGLRVNLPKYANRRAKDLVPAYKAFVKFWLANQNHPYVYVCTGSGGLARSRLDAAQRILAYPRQYKIEPVLKSHTAKLYITDLVENRKTWPSASRYQSIYMGYEDGYWYVRDW